MAEIVKKERVPYRIWDKVNSKWNELMLKTNAKSVDADDGKTLETKIGAINGITSDLNGESEDVAASIKCVNQLNNSLGGFRFKTVDGEKKVSTDGGSTWENFSNGAVLLWENSAPTSVFNAQTIEIDLSNYDSIIISFISQPTLGWTSKYRFFILKNESQGCNVPMNSDSTTEIANVWARIVSVSNKGVKIGYALEDERYAQNACMPIEIYGIKSVIKQK